jgi:3-hydroxyacyl-[acyl-carrier-protein] dehydratase
LTDHLYTIKSENKDDNSFSAVLEWNPGHDIFKGHFPTVPVVPGVCMMDLIREMLERVAGTPVKILSVPVMKFLNLINPLQTSTVQLQLSYTSTDLEQYLVTASLFNEGVVYFKFKGTMVKENE